MRRILEPSPDMRKPRLRIERAAPDSPQDLKLPDAALVAVVRRWRRVRAELGLAKLLERGIRAA